MITREITNECEVSLEDLDVRMAAGADPRGFLNNAPDGAVLDEIQRLPVLLSLI